MHLRGVDGSALFQRALVQVGDNVNVGAGNLAAYLLHGRDAARLRQISRISPSLAPEW